MSADTIAPIGSTSPRDCPLRPRWWSCCTADSGSAEQAERAYGWDELADSGKFVVAYPDGLGRAWNVDGEAAAAGRDEKASTTSPSSARPSPTSPRTSASIPPGLRHRHEQRRHHVLHAGVQHRHLRGDRPGRGHAAGPVPAPHRRRSCTSTAPPIALVPYGGGQGFSVINGPPVPSGECVLAQRRSVRRPGRHDRRPGHHVDRRMRRQPQRRAHHRRRGGHEWPAFATRTLWEFFAAHPR